MDGILKFQVTGKYGTDHLEPEEVKREDMLQQIGNVRALGFKSECVYHLDGSISIRLYQHAQAYTITITGSFKPLTKSYGR